MHVAIEGMAKTMVGPTFDRSTFARKFGLQTHWRVVGVHLDNTAQSHRSEQRLRVLATNGLAKWLPTLKINKMCHNPLEAAHWETPLLGISCPKMVHLLPLSDRRAGLGRRPLLKRGDPQSTTRPPEQRHSASMAARTNHAESAGNARKTFPLATKVAIRQFHT